MSISYTPNKIGSRVDPCVTLQISTYLYGSRRGVAILFFARLDKTRVLEHSFIPLKGAWGSGGGVHCKFIKKPHCFIGSINLRVLVFL